LLLKDRDDAAATMPNSDAKQSPDLLIEAKGGLGEQMSGDGQQGQPKKQGLVVGVDVTFKANEVRDSQRNKVPAPLIGLRLRSALDH
jgi:hypothetical protein